MQAWTKVTKSLSTATHRSAPPMDEGDRLARNAGELMSVLVTGSSGYVGLAVALRLQSAGRNVFGLTDTVAGTKVLESWGITPLLASLEDTETIRNAVALVDSVIDIEGYLPSAQMFLSILRGTGKHYIRTSSAVVYADRAGGSSQMVSKEAAVLPHGSLFSDIVETDVLVQNAAHAGVQTIVLRPSLVYGDAGGPVMSALIRKGLSSGRSLYIGDGTNRQSTVYRADLAEAYVLALEKAPSGRIYNLAHGECSTFDIAAGIAKVLGLPPAETCSLEASYGHFGAGIVDDVLSRNCRVDATRAKIELGWQPKGPALLDDLAEGSYAAVWS